MKTIFMKKEDWQKWDTALRSGEYEQAPEQLHSGGNGYCCLGVLEKCLDGVIENVEDELPSPSWLRDHGITFVGIGDANTDPSDARNNRAPFLPKIGKRADDANDVLTRADDDDDFSDVVHKFDFIAIADAIAEAVEFTDA